MVSIGRSEDSLWLRLCIRGPGGWSAPERLGGRANASGTRKTARAGDERESQDFLKFWLNPSGSSRARDVFLVPEAFFLCPRRSSRGRAVRAASAAFLRRLSRSRAARGARAGPQRLVPARRSRIDVADVGAEAALPSSHILFVERCGLEKVAQEADLQRLVSMDRQLSPGHTLHTAISMIRPSAGFAGSSSTARQPSTAS